MLLSPEPVQPGFRKPSTHCLGVGSHVEQGKRQRWVTLGVGSAQHGQEGGSMDKKQAQILTLRWLLGNRATAVAMGSSGTAMRQH